MWWHSLLKIILVVLLPLGLAGCDFGSVGKFFASGKKCTTGSKFEQASCLTRQYQAICQAGGFGLRDNLNRLRKINNNDVGTRICKRRIAITIGPVINGVNITGTLAEQSNKTETQCYQSMGRDRILCNARVKLHFLSSQFKVACLASIPWYTANDLMFKTVGLRDQVLKKTKIKGNLAYRTDSKWYCHNNTSVAGLNKPRLKRVYAEPENKIVQAVFSQVQQECSSTPQKQASSKNLHTMSHNLSCILPKMINRLGKKFASICKEKNDRKVKDKALGDVVHARKFLAMLHPDHFRKSSFVWLCSKRRIFVKSRYIIAPAKATITAANPIAIEEPILTSALVPTRNRRKNIKWKARKNRARMIGLKRNRRTKSLKRRRATTRRKRKANRPDANSFSYQNANF